jgi:hypothetical protein
MPKSNRENDIRHDVMYEARDVNAGLIGLVAVGVIVSGFVINEAVKWSYKYFSRAEFRGAQPVTLVKQPRSPVPPPLLQVNPADDLQKMREANKQILEGYGWVDQQKGIVRIPIEQAMKLVVERGLPPAEKPSPSPSSTQAVVRTK